MMCSIVKMDVEVSVNQTSLAVVVKSERNSVPSKRKVLVLSRFSCDGGGRYTTAKLTEELFIIRSNIQIAHISLLLLF